LNWVRADGPKGTSLPRSQPWRKKAHAALKPVFRKPTHLGGGAADRAIADVL
jgi:hypothetical protein